MSTSTATNTTATTPTNAKTREATARPASPAQSERCGAIDLAGVEKRYADGATAVSGIDLHIEAGTYCCLLGPSGCGKTTILRMIAGHESPTRGSLLIDGKNVVGMTPRERGTAMMFQNYALFPHLSVRDNIAFSLRVRGVGKRERRYEADRVIEQVQLGALADRLPGQLSGGQQQRVALARAIIMRPAVLLLDEPLSALDEFLRLQMRSELRDMQIELGITFIHVTHTQLEAIAVADQVVVMEKGRIAQSATPRDIYAEPVSSYVANFIGGQNVLHGMLANVAGDVGTLTSADDVRFALSMPNHSVRIGERLAFAVRRDRILVESFDDSRRAPINSVCGVVHTVEYQGTHLKIGLKLDAEDGEFSAYVEDSVFLRAPVVVGQRAMCHWSIQDAHYLCDA
ncbi:ABC transporter ATP-binding protein [Pararobbsia silviterrae]|uniref:ABC transporter ATP-binding protein n=1 Tax=Pararobbsia silviterrae TaxID=1792498 RepID=A0A494XA55_9BURK|nr:ABC transporter ATP-binding protein [Pararobbsia silviterrae]RKP47687.1 ABC transporter ATP-binding protein [Pararobbsia silviterrae]